MTTFKDQIHEVHYMINQQSYQFQKRNNDMLNIVLTIFNSYKYKTFSKQYISKKDILNSICLFINNNFVSKTNLIILNIYIKNLTDFNIDISYFFKNQQQLLFLSNCEKDNFLVKVQ